MATGSAVAGWEDSAAVDWEAAAAEDSAETVATTATAEQGEEALKRLEMVVAAGRAALQAAVVPEAIGMETEVDAEEWAAESGSERGWKKADNLH